MSWQKSWTTPRLSATRKWLSRPEVRKNQEDKQNVFQTEKDTDGKVPNPSYDGGLYDGNENDVDWMKRTLWANLVNLKPNRHFTFISIYLCRKSLVQRSSPLETLYTTNSSLRTHCQVTYDDTSYQSNYKTTTNEIWHLDAFTIHNQNNGKNPIDEHWPLEDHRFKVPEMQIMRKEGARAKGWRVEQDGITGNDRRQSRTKDLSRGQTHGTGWGRVVVDLWCRCRRDFGRSKGVVITSLSSKDRHDTERSYLIICNKIHKDFFPSLPLT